MQSHTCYVYTYSSYVYISHCHWFYNNRNVTYVIAYIIIVCATHRQVHFNHARCTQTYIPLHVFT